jgi:Zn-finger nucleic acid-binding protein
VAFSGVIMALFRGFISRERELLADAAAVEIGRSPEALARAIYKATLKNSFVGDFQPSYAPLFIVSPGEDPAGPSRFRRLFETHPPVSKRLEALAAMAGLTTADIRARVRDQIEEREKNRPVLPSVEERQERRQPDESGAKPDKQQKEEPPSEARIWLFRGRGGDWVGPLTLTELVGHPRLTTMDLVRNAQEQVEAKAREFPQVRLALKAMAGRGSKAPRGDGRCPRCRVPLGEAFYEGVPVRNCPRCHGLLVDLGLVDRIVARREVAFSEGLRRKALEFRDRVLLNPLQKEKATGTAAGGYACPVCGWRMVARPYNYQDFIPVDKCLSCHRVWFDADELETLQVLVEERTGG